MKNGLDVAEQDAPIGMVGPNKNSTANGYEEEL